MNVEFMNPFLVSTINVMKTMAQTDAKPGKPFVKSDKSAKGDVTGIVGMRGAQAKGSLAITFTEPAILHIYSQMLGEKAEKISDELVDCVGEITNMICGGAKALLSEKGYKFEMAIPSMVAGKNHMVFHKTNGKIICIPFETSAGSFFLEICFEE
ncbi:MAG: chemotaxis protein CheX [Nitrospirae bacterium]|nr:chemotaxis protein CheX [Nitrospirota bacterium]